MKIYTKTGDDGSTGLFGGARVDKDDPRVEAYGTVDELNSVVGLARATSLPDDLSALLSEVQEQLFVVGAELATVAGKESKLPMRLIGAAEVQRLEEAIDQTEAGLPQLTNFILPGGAPSGAALHHARTVCRRAERAVIVASRVAAVRSELKIYLNRLSDFLFVAARRANFAANVPESPWAPRGQ
jgi:cob(I)alamin adenosyltransferase